MMIHGANMSKGGVGVSFLHLRGREISRSNRIDW